MRLIDADALLERIMDINSWYLYNEWGSETEFHKLIDEAPTVEPTDTDLISRADAIETIMSEPMNEPKYPIWFADKLKELPSAEQVISKLNNPCDSLLTDESNGSKEQKSKLDIISRADAIKAVAKLQKYDLDERNRLRIYAPWHKPKRIFVETEAVYKCIYTMPSADAEPSLKAIKRQIDEHWYLDLPSAEAEEYDDYEHATLVDIKEPLKVEVVQCKDCEHWDTADGECYGLDGVHYSKADDFCSHGERKEP